MIHLESKFLDSNPRESLVLQLSVLSWLCPFFDELCFPPLCDSTNSSDDDKTFFSFYANKFPRKLLSFIWLAFPMTDFIYL